jgi:hypothetical protein
LIKITGLSGREREKGNRNAKQSFEIEAGLALQMFSSSSMSEQVSKGHFWTILSQ